MCIVLKKIKLLNLIFAFFNRLFFHLSFSKSDMTSDGYPRGYVGFDYFLLYFFQDSP